MAVLSLILISLTMSFQAATAPRSVPVGEEPRHHVRWENKYLRVIEAIVPPGDTTLYHTHSRDNVPIAIKPCRLRTTLLGSSPSNETSVVPGTTTWAVATYTHQIENLGGGPIHYIDAELISATGIKAEPTLNGLPGHTLIFENEKVRAYRVILKPGQSTGSHTHRLPFLNVSVSGGELIEDRKGTKQKFNPGSFAWFDKPLTHSLKNGGTTEYEMVDLELK